MIGLFKQVVGWQRKDSPDGAEIGSPEAKSVSGNRNSPPHNTHTTHSKRGGTANNPVPAISVTSTMSPPPALEEKAEPSVSRSMSMSPRARLPDYLPPPVSPHGSRNRGTQGGFPGPLSPLTPPPAHVVAAAKQQAHMVAPSPSVTSLSPDAPARDITSSADEKESVLGSDVETDGLLNHKYNHGTSNGVKRTANGAKGVREAQASVSPAPSPSPGPGPGPGPAVPSPGVSKPMTQLLRKPQAPKRTQSTPAVVRVQNGKLPELDAALAINSVVSSSRNGSIGELPGHPLGGGERSSLATGGIGKRSHSVDPEHRSVLPVNIPRSARSGRRRSKKMRPAKRTVSSTDVFTTGDKDKQQRSLLVPKSKGKKTRNKARTPAARSISSRRCMNPKHQHHHGGHGHRHTHKHMSRSQAATPVGSPSPLGSFGKGGRTRPRLRAFSTEDHKTGSDKSLPAMEALPPTRGMSGSLSVRSESSEAPRVHPHSVRARQGSEFRITPPVGPATTAESVWPAPHALDLHAGFHAGRIDESREQTPSSGVPLIRDPRDSESGVKIVVNSVAPPSVHVKSGSMSSSTVSAASAATFTATASVRVADPPPPVPGAGGGSGSTRKRPRSPSESMSRQSQFSDASSYYDDDGESCVYTDDEEESFSSAMRTEYSDEEDDRALGEESDQDEKSDSGPMPGDEPVSVRHLPFVDVLEDLAELFNPLTREEKQQIYFIERIRLPKGYQPPPLNVRMRPGCGANSRSPFSPPTGNTPPYRTPDARSPSRGGGGKNGDPLRDAWGAAQKAQQRQLRNGVRKEVFEASRMGPHVWLGPLASLFDEHFVMENRISAAFSAMSIVRDLRFYDGFVHAGLAVTDGVTLNLIRIFPTVVQIIERLLGCHCLGEGALVRVSRRRREHRCPHEPRNVLIHCKQGASRSATLFIAFLMWHDAYSYERAFEHCKAQRCVVYPNLSFVSQLKLFEFVLRYFRHTDRDEASFRRAYGREPWISVAKEMDKVDSWQEGCKAVTHAHISAVFKTLLRDHTEQIEAVAQEIEMSSRLQEKLRTVPQRDVDYIWSVHPNDKLLHMITDLSSFFLNLNHYMKNRQFTTDWLDETLMLRLARVYPLGGGPGIQDCPILRQANGQLKTFQTVIQWFFAANRNKRSSSRRG